jgi:hypothetical protein
MGLKKCGADGLSKRGFDALVDVLRSMLFHEHCDDLLSVTAVFEGVLAATAPL